MAYEDSVYLAKLAEQAERYEGETNINTWDDNGFADRYQKWWTT